ncbi:hypothetical protein JOD29_001750 [Lysinibacillus composti]|uniref:YndJ-like protein n=1 Tax=Lysinibacillus composti TaxID=720633 RepID=A0A3N9USD5_9BACI|nr:YndJ family protein [Lysinibacillus composti]MBM7608505.1 hypothetical protein [Lysinibacillus composti]RQW74796.1 hypothetical protein EBB45_09335 [Lysinibacillus composti]
MLANLRKSFANPISLFGMGLFILCCFFQSGPTYLLYLTVAQLVFVPVMLQCIIALKRIEKCMIVLGMVGVACISIWSAGWLSVLCAVLYLLSSCTIALIGIRRFLHRGFTNIAEITIDVALIYVLVGGLWFFASISGIETGFSSIITWLTAIHFHYSGFLLNMSVGLFGRIGSESKWYSPIAIILMTGLMLVAMGITFSPIIEMISVVLYIGALYCFLVLVFRTKMARFQGICLRLSMITLCVTIIWSLLYAFGNLTFIHIVSITDMLAIHGLLNCILFGGFTVLAWVSQTPESKQVEFTFSVSQIRGKLQTYEKTDWGLVDKLEDFCDTSKLPKSIVDFYEKTDSYRLYASVQWRTWFKPLALIYKGFSRMMKQINLPFARRKVEMTGEIVMVDALEDGRIKPRAWIRKINDETVFTAIYSKHKSDRTYMNIALPLPFSSMNGILALHEENGKLHLTSNASGDAGTYLAIKQFVFQLPIHEHFVIEETSPTTLTAVHNMHIFGIHFLRIDYEIGTRGQVPRPTFKVIG